MSKLFLWYITPLDLVVMTYFLDACSVLSGIWCGLDVGLIPLTLTRHPYYLFTFCKYRFNRSCISFKELHQHIILGPYIK
jgi:hypothetical protein